MKIKEFSQLTNLSAHTLRYYEKIGLLHPVRHKENGHREYNDADIHWVGFIKRLKETGMALSNIQKYAELRAAGEHTAKERMELLQDHAGILSARIKDEQAHLKNLKEKIAFYQEFMLNNKSA